MPYFCAKAVCTTFCHNIAGALIPIYGPDFPSQCARPDAPEYGRMVIHPQVVTDATREAEIYRRIYLNTFTPVGPPNATSPKRDRRDLRGSYQHDRRLRLKARLSYDSPYSTDTDGDGSRSGPESALSTSTGVLANGYMYTTSSGWTAANRVGSPHTRHLYHHDQYHQASPWLSAVPRFAPTSNSHFALQSQAYSAKRHIDNDDTDCGYEASESQNGSSPATSAITVPQRHDDPATHAAEKNAAVMLMNLSVQDKQWQEDAVSEAAKTDDAPEMHRNKRRRASSM
jgi:hypothetical protein